MMPDALHDPPIPVFGTSQIVREAPPDTDTTLSLPGTKNPIIRLSGDQNGKLAVSVSAITCETTESIAWTHSSFLPSWFAMNASRVPSGERAMPLPKPAFSGGGI